MIRIQAGIPRRAPEALLREAAKALKNGTQTVYVVVPKQLTLHTELTLIRALEPGGSFRLNVLSPERLCARIFETAGRPSLERVDDRGRVMLARRALNDCGDALFVYKGAAHRRGFPARAARQLELFRQAGLTPEDLLNLADEQTGLFAAKLADMSKLMESYLRALEGRFLDGEAEFEAAAARAGDSDVIRNSGMIFYGFDVMPRPLHALIARLGLFASVTLIFAADPALDAPDAEAYVPVNRSIGRLRELASSMGAQVEVGRFDETRDESPARPGGLEHLSGALFALRPPVREKDAEGVSLTALKNPREEAAFVAAKCRALAMKGARWNSMLIAAPDISSYARCLEDAFAAFEIPIFLSSSRPASRHPLSEALLSALKLIWKGFRTEDALALLRTGYADVENPDELAGYLEKYMPRGRGLSAPFVYGGEEAPEAARKALIDPVLRLRDGLREAENLTGQLTALFGYLTETGAFEKSQRHQASLAQEGLNRLAGEESQVWNRVISTMDQMNVLMGEKRLSLEDLSETLRESLDSAVIKPLPQSADAVYAQSLDQAVSVRADYVFFMGMGDRVYSGMDGLFTERQMQDVSRSVKKWICPDATEQALMRRFYLKSALAAAGREAAFTYAVSAEDGSSQRAAALLQDVKRMLPALKEGGGLGDEEELTALFLSAPGAAKRTAFSRLETRAGRSAAATLSNLPGMDVEGLLHAFDRRHLAEQLSPETAKKIYGTLNSASVTRLEQFGRCPFAHFMRYALSPEKREPFVLNARDEGGFYHDAVRAFLTDARHDLSAISPEEAHRRMDEVTDLLLERMEQSRLFDTFSSRAEKRRLKATARSAAEALVNQLSGSRFAPVEMELEFGREDGAGAIRLSTEGGPCFLEGRIDRVDEWNSPGEDFLRVIDYKKGGKALKLFEAYCGLQMQLIVYLAAAMRRRGDVGAGVYYFKIDEGIVNTQSTDPAEIDAERRKSMRLDGITLSERPVIDAMSPDGETIRVRFKADGTLYASSPAVDRDVMELLIARTLKNAAGNVNRIRAGEAAPSPMRTSRENPCAYCDHRSACLFDDTLDARQVRRVEEMTGEEVLARLRTELM